MIVNSSVNHGQIDSHQYDSYYLKRKLDNSMIDNENGDCEQSRKRQMKNLDFTNNMNGHYDNNGYNNMSNNVYNIDCQNIEFLNYENPLTPVEIMQRGTTYTGEHEQYDNWNNSDLLELGQKYTTAVLDAECIEKYDLQQQNSSAPQMDPDFEDRNLSWLFNFKLNELPHLSPEVNRNQQQSPNKNQNGQNQSKLGRKNDDLSKMEMAEIDENDIVVAENVVIENTQKAPKKPPFTYTELIEYALEDKRELTVSGIYQWISDRFPFYKSNDDRWKNSVRHNLSINPHFRKGVKAPQGAGHLWTISSRDSEENALAWEHKKQRLELFFKMETSQKNRTSSTNEPYDETAQAAASIAQQLQNESNSAEEISNHSSACERNIQMTLDMMQQDDLKKTAGEILNGVRRNVEVQVVNSATDNYSQNVLETGDYLNPISKDDIVIESGLRSSQNRNEVGDDYYVTEIDPIELGINMSNVEEEVLFSDEFNLNYFGITSGNDIMA